MSERRSDSQWYLWVLVLGMVMMLFAYVKINEAEIRDLQRRVGQLESERR